MSPGPIPTPDVGNMIRFQFDPNRPVSSPSISERMRNSQLSSTMSPMSPNGPTYARVYRQPASDELDFHLQRRTDEASNHNLRPSEFLRRNNGGDINPSRGNIIESESELDIAHLEESVSPISVSPPLSESPNNNQYFNREPNNNRIKGKKNLKNPGEISPETDF